VWNWNYVKMTLLQSCMRNLRRKFYFVLIFGVMGLVYIGSYAWNDCIFCSSDDETIIHLRKLNQPFSWGDSLEENESETNSSSYTPLTCRNSLQGKTIVTDDKGYVCERDSLLGTGCCNTNSSLGRFDCSTCDLKIECCSQYENCISCCLRREQKPILQQFLKQAAENNNVLFVSVSDHFELCLAKCRTSSTSVQHENTYRNKDRKHCYGKDAPPIFSSPQPWTKLRRKNRIAQNSSKLFTTTCLVPTSALYFIVSQYVTIILLKCSNHLNSKCISWFKL